MHASPPPGSNIRSHRPYKPRTFFFGGDSILVHAPDPRRWVTKSKTSAYQNTSQLEKNTPVTLDRIQGQTELRHTPCSLSETHNTHRRTATKKHYDKNSSQQCSIFEEKKKSPQEYGKTHTSKIYSKIRVYGTWQNNTHTHHFEGTLLNFGCIFGENEVWHEYNTNHGKNKNTKKVT